MTTWESQAMSNPPDQPTDDTFDFAKTGFVPVSSPTPEQAEQAQEEAAVGTPLLEHAGFYVAMARRSPVRIPPRNGEKHAILVVEDDADLAQLVIDVFMNAGFEMRWAANRAEINAQLHRQPAVDLVLLDIRLPDANGLNVLKCIRAHPTLGTLPVIMMTGMATAEDVAAGLLSGADGYVTKPFKMSGLVRAVNEVLGNA
jgi:two-component system, OmpR family, response regulator